MPDYDFSCRSPSSRLWADIAWDGEEALLAEATRTAQAYAAAMDGRVAKGVLTGEAALRGHQVLLAIVADFEAQRDYLATIHAGGVPARLADRLVELARQSGVHWPEKVDALRAEILARRLGNAGDVAKGRLTAADAHAQLERLEAVHWVYWKHGFAWESPTGAAPHSPAWRAELRDHGARMDEAELETEKAA